MDKLPARMRFALPSPSRAHQLHELPGTATFLAQEILLVLEKQVRPAGSQASWTSDQHECEKPTSRGCSRSSCRRSASLPLSSPFKSPGLPRRIGAPWTGSWRSGGVAGSRCMPARTAPTTPQKAVQGTALEARHRVHSHGLGPLIIVPYLSEKRLGELQVLEVSGLDLCGNGILLGPHFSIWRSGQPNRFPESPTHPQRLPRHQRHLRAVLSCSTAEFPTLTSLQQHAREHCSSAGQGPDHTGTLTIGTASKVVQSLEQQMIVALQGLLENYRPPVGPHPGRQGLPSPSRPSGAACEARTHLSACAASPRDWARHSTTGPHRAWSRHRSTCPISQPPRNSSS